MSTLEPAPGNFFVKSASADNPTVSLMLVDPSALVRAGLKSVLAEDPSLRVAAEAVNLREAEEAARAHRPDLVIMEIQLPDGNGIRLCKSLLHSHPSTRILVLTSVVDDTRVWEALQAGAHGFLLKDIDSKGLIRAIHDVSRGKSILDPGITGKVLEFARVGRADPQQKMFDQLSHQEKRVVALVAEGKTNKEIAAEMNLSDKTVKNYLSNVFEKLQINRRSQAATFYTQTLSTRSRTIHPY